MPDGINRDLPDLLDATPRRVHDGRMLARSIVVIAGSLFGVLLTVGLALMDIPPEAAKSNAAAWFKAFGLSWGEEFTATTDIWITIALATALVLVILGVFLMWRGDAARRNPSNGSRISRVMMKALTMSRVETLYQDFMAQPHKTNEICAIVARFIRQHRRAVGEEEAWNCYALLDEAREKYGSRVIGDSIADLERAFPLSWWESWRIGRQEQRYEKRAGKRLKRNGEPRNDG